MFSITGKSFAFLLLFVSSTAFGAGVAAAQNKSAGATVLAASERFLNGAPRRETIDRSAEKAVAETLGSPNDFRRNARGNVEFVFEKSDAATIEKVENDPPRAADRAKINEFAYRFDSRAASRRILRAADFLPRAAEKPLTLPSPPSRNTFGDDKKIASVSADDNANDVKSETFQWRSAINQSLMFLAVQHGYAFTQPKTREALKQGAFWRDYADSVKSLRGWADGGRFFTNYIAHPMQGSLTGFIYVQNDPKARKVEFAESKTYWTSRLKAMAWSAAWSTQFEIGPISQASIGNVGLKGKQTWIDIVVTPTVGTAMLISEEAVDRIIIKAIERRTKNFYVKVFARMLLNPTRNFSNLLRFKEPWYRDRETAR